jgi:beta propeller repeat protein
VRNGNETSDIYMYGISIHKETQITTSGSHHYNPAVYGDKIVWKGSSEEYGKGDIYIGTLNYLSVAAFSGSPTSGKAPLKVTFTDKSWILHFMEM